MKTNDIIRQIYETIQYFIKHDDNQPDTEFSKNVDKLIKLKADLANETKTRNEIDVCPMCWAEMDEGICINTQCLTNNGISVL
jgi:hypothetical protein